MLREMLSFRCGLSDVVYVSRASAYLSEVSARLELGREDALRGHRWHQA